MAKGNYTPDQIKDMSDLDILFLHHYQAAVESENQKFITDVLGVLWDAEEFKQPEVAEGGEAEGSRYPDKLFIPLSMAVNPELVNSVKETMGFAKDGKKTSKAPFIGGGEHIPKKGEVYKSMGELSKEDFKKLIGAR